MMNYDLWRDAWQETLESDWAWEKPAYPGGVEEYISAAYRDYVECEKYQEDDDG